ncbi:MAG: 30S ribosomal protein S6 [Rhodothermales bacterium]|nr:30S ribosomal protein S6 [Rhodothermales bacterium]
MSALQTYEMMYIVNAVYSDEQIADLVTRVDNFIKEGGGDIVEKELWGSRRLAYPIAKKRNGYYVNLVFTAPGTLIARLERAMDINEGILRYLTLKMDAVMTRHRDARKSRLAAEAAAVEAEAAATADDKS